MARMARRTEVNECRRCATFCDRVISPASCVAAACPALYEYDDELTGRRFMGCVHKVFAAEIDVVLFKEAQRTRAGFGAVKLATAPRPECQFSVERAYEGEPACVNRRFADWPDAALHAFRAFDIRELP
jgi:hypothetical protein